MRSTRPIFWIFVPVLLAISAGAIWGTFNYGPIGKPSQSAIECENLHTFVTAEEASGKASWNEYRKLIDEYLAIDDASDQRVPVIENMASTVIDVLGHDLAIYKEMNKYPACVLQEKRSEISGMITETETAINFLNGSTPINGNYFDPQLGTWNTTYYEEYLSALDFLKPIKKDSV